MIEARDFIEPAKAHGFRTWAGVPCSFLTPFINSVINDDDMQYISSANEGDAVATASGAALAGERSVAMMQNSGLGNAVSPLSSLNWVFRIPILLIITLRGEPGIPDEPQHELMGQITGRILDDLQIPWDWFPRDVDSVEGALMVASWQMEKTGLPYALVMRKGSVAPASLNSALVPGPGPGGSIPVAGMQPELTRKQVLETVIDHTPEKDSVVIGTTGFTGRELFAIQDRSNHFYMVGSMGCASSLGLGLSIAMPDRRIVVADGDGALLMRMGNLATIGAYGGANFQHIVLDNGVHESTGGQATVSGSLSLAGIAAASGYHSSAVTVKQDDIHKFMKNPNGPSFLQVKTRVGVPEGLPRPDLSPVEVKERLMKNLGVSRS